MMPAVRERKTITVAQGSAEWIQLRLHYYCASDAPAMMGLSPYKTRDDLLREKVIGVKKEIDPYTRKLFSAGHAAETLAAGVLAKEAGELYPEVWTAIVDGHPMLASLDGSPMDNGFIFEHKLWSDELASALRSGNVPDRIWPQLEHQMLVSGINSTLLVTSDGTLDRREKLWYAPDPDRRAALMAGWEQFNLDARVYPGYKPQPLAPAGRNLLVLPVLDIRVSGTVLSENLTEFEARAKKVIEGISLDLRTDEHFSDAKQSVKWMCEIETKLLEAKQRAVQQIDAVSAIFRTMDGLRDEVRPRRLHLQKLITDQNLMRKTEIVENAWSEYRKFIATIASGSRLDWASPGLPPDNPFRGVVQGLSSLTVMREKCSNKMAGLKIDARVKIHALASLVAEYSVLVGPHDFLFPDKAALVRQDNFISVVKSRISDYVQDRAARDLEDDRLEAPRGRKEPERLNDPVTPEIKKLVDAFISHAGYSGRRAKNLDQTLIAYERFRANHMDANPGEGCEVYSFRDPAERQRAKSREFSKHSP